MSILKEIKSKNLEARKSGNHVTARALTTLISEIEKVGKDNGNRETSDNEAINIIKKFKKDILFNLDNLKNVITYPEKRRELESELSLISSFLPKQLNDEELTNIIKDIISHDSNINIGKVMKFLSAKYFGLYDAKKASEITKNLIP